MWKLQEILNKDWEKIGIVVISAGGKNNVDRPTVVFKGLNIPTYFIFDGDADCSADDIKKKNHRYLRLADVKKIEDFPCTQVHDNWAVFDINLDNTIKSAIGEDNYSKFGQKVAKELGYSKVKDVCKNIEGAALLIETIYQEGHRVEVLEEIVEKITKLCN